MPFANELRLLFTLTLTAGVFASAYALARRLGAGGRLQAVCDALLLGYVIQYISVALPGIVGQLSVPTMAMVALAGCALCWIGARAHRLVTPAGLFADAPPASVRSPRQTSGNIVRLSLLLRGTGRPDRLGLLASGAFVGAFTMIYAVFQSGLPILSTDPLVYHLPAAVQWMQTGRLGLFDTWYWNPAATWSPATSSTFMYWLIAPMRNDVLVRFVQVTPLLLIFCVVARLCRILGCGLTVSGLIAMAATLCRPFFSQAMFPKDDLIVTAFFGVAVLSLSGNNPRDRLGPWRVGLAFGMLLASKYTILLACPLFLFMFDAPLRAIRDAGRRVQLNWGLAVLIALALFAPWYLRTWRITGNPLYPVDVRLFGHTIFSGMFTTERDQQLRTVGGTWKMLTESYHSVPLLPLLLATAGWLAALVGTGRAAWREPLLRACIFGAPATLILFLLASPHHEVRYVFPLFLLFFATVGVAICRWIPTGKGVRIATAAVIAGVSVGTTFTWYSPNGIVRGLFQALSALTAGALLSAALAAAAAFGLAKLARTRPDAAVRTVAGSTLAAVVALLLYLYVAWPEYMNTYRQQGEELWRVAYKPQGELWMWVRDQTPPDATIAFANTSFVYPLYGFDLSRRVVYAPVRPDVASFDDVPRLGDTVPGNDIVIAMTRTQNDHADRATWQRNLDRLGVQYLLVHKSELLTDPPELRFGREEPARFVPVFENEHGVIFQIRR